MSSIAAAKKRRAGITASVPEPPRLPNGGVALPQQQPQQGLTLPQVIALLDSRITKLEKSANDKPQVQSQVNEQELLPSNITDILDDFQEKFVILAGEINSLKDIVLKLQSYTMDVNKILLEDRIQVLSDIGENDRFILETNDTNTEQNNTDENKDENNSNYESDSKNNIVFHYSESITE
jgi:hypothetical protein